MGRSGVTVHNFADSLALSNQHADAPWWESVYRRAFPGFSQMMSVRNDGWAQRGGIDRIVLTEGGRQYAIDEKVRTQDRDDFCLEAWSDFERRVPGWMNKDLACDFIAYAFVPSRRCYLLPFATLRLAWKRNGAGWMDSARRDAAGFRVIRADNGRYTTLSVAVPIDVVMASLQAAMLVRWEPSA